MARYKGCPRCGKKMLLEIKGQCEECRKGKYKYLKTLPSIKNNNVHTVYSRARWQKTRIEVIKRARGMCEVCYCFGKRVPGEEVHHIIKVRQGNYETNYDLGNLVYACKKCHSRIEGMNHIRLLEYLEQGGE